MNEIQISEGGSAPRFLYNQYRGVTSDVKARWQPYEYARQPFEVPVRIFDALDLKGQESIVDVGCSDGDALHLLRWGRLHRGQMLGVDLHEDLFTVGAYNNTLTSNRQVQFMVADAQNLPLADESVDVVMAMFMLYHLNDYHQGLAEFRRVLKPGGKLAVATSGPANKVRHRQFEEQLAFHLGINKPPVFAERFNSRVAENELPKWFATEHLPTQLDEMIFTTENYDAYIDSINSMKNAFTPPPPAGRWVQAVGQVVEPAIQAEIAANGYFSDTIERDIYICTKA